MRAFVYLLFSLLMIVAIGGCATVRFNEREHLQDRVMQFDPDPLQAEMHGHVHSPREGAVGGFSPSGAGGCGCQ